MLKIVRGKGRRKEYHEVHTVRRNLFCLFVQRKENVVAAILSLYPQVKTDRNKGHFQQLNPALGKTGIFHLNKEADT